MKKNSIFTKKDLIFIGILIAAAIIGLGVWAYITDQNQKNTTYFDIYYGSEVVHSMPTNKDDTYTLTGDYGEMVVEVKDGSIRVKEVECPNHICEYTGWVEQGSYLGIYCVPNDIVILERHND